VSAHERPTVVLTRRDVAGLIDMRECVEVVEGAFRSHAAGETIPPAVLGIHVGAGGIHIKSAGLLDERRTFAVKVNANYPDNPARHGLPTIQGLIALFDVATGFPLAFMDSIEVTSLRTAAATAVAAKYLAREDARTVAICGCGEQGRSQLRALATVRTIEVVRAFDIDPASARRYAAAMRAELGIDVTAVEDLASATRVSDIVVTCTPSREWYLGRDHVATGTFVAAVGADSESKQEIEPALLAASTIVADVLEQCAAIGDLHHALVAGVMTREQVHAELADVISGRRPGRRASDEVVIFDSTGTALQDVAVAALVHERARAAGVGISLDLGSR
jgi:alanine dehydrogenase